MLDDTLDEPDEEFTLTLSNAVQAVLAGGEATLTASGRIEDDDLPPRASIEDARLSEGDAGGGVMRFAVTLEPASGRTVTVQFATAEGTATAEADYTSASGAVTFAAGSTDATVSVAILDDVYPEAPETFTVTLSGGQNVTVSGSGATATGTITDDGDAELELASLQVTGGRTMYPAFTPEIHHYALACNNGTTLQVTAEATRTGAAVTLLRADSADDHTAYGTLDVQVRVNKDHDIAIEVSDADGTKRYVVHCVPLDFPELRILTKTAGVSDGLLFITPARSDYAAVVDNNGVPRLHLSNKGRVFQHHANGPTILGRQVRYSAGSSGSVRLLDADFLQIRSVRVVAPLTHTDRHDFRIITDDTSGESTYLFVSYHDTTRDGVAYKDSVIQEVSTTGTEVYRWNSWDHLKLDPDCRRGGITGDYAHLNSLYVFEGDIIASFPGCGQVVRIERSAGTWTLKWKIGGTTPPRKPLITEYLELVGDPAGEFCGQHHASITSEGKLLMFDNGNNCLGERKNEAPYTRIVEYDISSETQAVFSRQYEPPDGYHTGTAGGVTELDNGNWLIAWGNTPNLGLNQSRSVSEVDPDTGTVHFEMLILRSSAYAPTYRAYRYPEADIPIPLSLP